MKIGSTFGVPDAHAHGFDGEREGGVMGSQLSVRVLDPTTNMPVVQFEGRRFPGVVIQGDRLASWTRIVKSGHPSDLELFRDELVQILAHYEAVLNSHNHPLPYAKTL